MRQVSLRCLPTLIVVILVLSSMALLLNHFFYKFPGNNYFPENIPLMILLLLLINWGLILIFGKNSRASSMARELVYYFGIMSLIALATNAIQLTPFPTIDKNILSAERLININMGSILIWTDHFPNFKFLLTFIYDTLPYQMTLVPLLIIATGRFELLRDYYFLLLCTTLFGFTVYYFFPTTAPASIINSPLFSADQLATGLKFHQIHHHIAPTTNEGGLIAFPSFHVVWALLCVYLFKEWILLCTLLFIINLFLIASCILLGWHYPIDVVGGLVLVGLSYYLLRLCKSTAIAVS